MRVPKPLVVLAYALGLGPVACQEAGPPADTIFIGDNIVTMDPNQPTVAAVAVRGETIVAAGARDDVMALQGDATRVVDLGDQALVPGFIDSHSHFIGAAEEGLDLDPPPVGDITSIDDIVRKVQQWIADKNIPPGEIVSGGGYDDSMLTEGRHPTRFDLDRASTDHPIVLSHVSGHLRALNSAALKASNITAATEDPPGGHIRRVAGSMEPNGVLEERAGGLVVRRPSAPKTPEEEQAEFDARARKATQVYNGYGVTTIQVGGGQGPQQIRAYRAAADREPLNADFVLLSSARGILDDSVQYEPSYRNGVRVAGVKMLVDGSPQGRTAWVTQPYDEGPPGAPADYRAYSTMDPDTFKALAAAVMKKGVPFFVHANGDAASDLMLDGVEEAIAGMPSKPDHRSVIIHAQIMRADQMDRVAELGVVPSFFSSHVFFWGDWHRRSFGEERASNISATGWARDRGVHFTIHTDAMVVPPNFMRALSITVNRKTRSGYVLGPDQQLTVMEALNALTLDAAYQYFEEDTKGSITVGKQADLVILGQNPLTADPAELENIPIVETFSRGRSVFRR